MKSIIINLTLLFVALSTLSAQVELPQGCNAIQDSVYITKGLNRNKQVHGPADSIYYLTRAYLCDDGREGSPRAPIGDSSVVMNNFKRNAIDLSRQWAAAVTIAGMKEEAVVRPVRTINRTTTNLFNQSIYPEMAKEVFTNFPDSLFLGDYRITPESGTTVDATLTRNAQGQFRLRWGSNNKQVFILSEVHLRVLSYSGTKDLDLIRRNASTAKWIDPAGGVTLVNKKLQAPKNK